MVDMRYDVTLTLGGEGGWSMTADAATPVDATAGVWVLDGYRQAWTLPDEWPCQPDPGTAQFSIAAIDPIGLPPMLVGTPVRAEVAAYVPSAFGPQRQVLMTFHGRLTDATARPTTLPVADPVTGLPTRAAALAVEFVAVDYLADLAEDYIGAAPWPQEYPDERVDRIFAAAGQTWLDLVSFNAADSFAPLDVDHQPLATVLEAHLAQVARVGNLSTPAVYGWQRPFVVPIVAPAGGDNAGHPAGTVQWAITAQSERATVGGGPLRLVQDGAVLGLFVDAAGDPYSNVAPTDYVDVDIVLKRDKGKSTNRVIISGEFQGLYGELGPDLSVTTPTAVAEFSDIVTARGPVTQSMDSTLRYVHSANLMAGMYLGDRADMAGRWGVESFKLYASDIADGAEFNRANLPALMPPYEQYLPGYNVSWPYGRPVVLSGLQPAHRLTPWPWLSGALAGVEFTLADGEFTYDLAIRPDTPRQAWAHQTAPWTTSATTPACAKTFKEKWPTVTANNRGDGTPYVDPRLTFYDMRLVRSQ